MKSARASLAPLLFLASCARACGDGAPGAADAAPDAADAAAVGALAPPRCRELPGAQRVAPDDLTVEVGTAVRAGTSVYVGLVRGNEAAVAVVAQDLGSSRVVDLGPVDPAAPPPVPAVDGADVFVAWARRGDAGRRVAIARLEDRAVVVWDVPLDAADDVELDVAVRGGEGLLAWTAGDGVHAVALARGGAVSATHDYGRAGTDTGSPRLEPRAGGYWLGWTAARPDVDASIEAIEGAGDRSATGWVELLGLDPAGAAARHEPMTLTARLGHAFAFDWRTSASSLEVVVRDDVQSGAATGGQIEMVRVEGDKNEPVRPLADGVGRGAPTVLGPWLVYSDPLEHARLLPLDVPGARPSAESALADSRPIWAGPATAGPDKSQGSDQPEDKSGQGGRLLVVRVGERGRGAEVRSLVCVESK